MCFQVYTVGPSGTSLLMWAATGNHGNQWTYANVILSNPGPFRVTFQAEVGGDVWTDIALDDISYTAECVAGGKAKVQPAVSFSPCASICFLISFLFHVFSATLQIFRAAFSNFHLCLVSCFPTFPVHSCSTALSTNKWCDPSGEASWVNGVLCLVDPYKLTVEAGSVPRDGTDLKLGGQVCCVCRPTLTFSFHFFFFFTGGVPEAPPNNTRRARTTQLKSV